MIREINDKYDPHFDSITHEIDYAASVCDCVLLMDKGVVVEEGPPEKILKDPDMDRTREFLRNHIEGAA